MGDRCYFEIKCRKQDTKPFEELGFTAQDWQEGEPLGAATMIDEEANYAHYDALPTNIPWTGTNAAGGNYGQCNHACDGQEYVSVETGHMGGYVCEIKNGNIEKTCRNRIIQYQRVLKRAEKLLKKGTK